MSEVVKSDLASHKARKNKLGLTTEDDSRAPPPSYDEVVKGRVEPTAPEGFTYPPQQPPQQQSYGPPPQQQNYGQPPYPPTQPAQPQQPYGGTTYPSSYPQQGNFQYPVAQGQPRAYGAQGQPGAYGLQPTGQPHYQYNTVNVSTPGQIPPGSIATTPLAYGNPTAMGTNEMRRKKTLICICCTLLVIIIMVIFFISIS